MSRAYAQAMLERNREAISTCSSPARASCRKGVADGRRSPRSLVPFALDVLLHTDAELAEACADPHSFMPSVMVSARLV